MTNAPSGGQADDDTKRPTGQRRWLGLAVLGVVATGAGAAWLWNGASEEPAASEPVRIRAVEAQTRDLVEFSDLDGTLSYASSRSIAVPLDGIVTDVIDDGDVVERGDVVLAVNESPVVVMYGDLPLYRTLSLGSEGDDVLMLERNLGSLGYGYTEDADGNEVDTGFVVDGVFDAATADAVNRWKSDLDRPADSQVSPTEVAVVSGPSVASNVLAEVGAPVQQQSPALSLNMTGSVRAVHAEHAGEVELLVSEGAQITSGIVLYTVDDQPVIAIVVPEDVDFDRNLQLAPESSTASADESADDSADQTDESDIADVTEGEDVQILEEMLLALGYDAGGDLDVDEEFDTATDEAVRDWQEDLQDTWVDVEIDGQLNLDDVVVVRPGTRVDNVTSRASDSIAGGSELFTWSDQTASRVVSTAVPVADQDKLSEGSTVDIELPDGTLVDGTVRTVSTSSVTDPMDPTADPELPVEITLDSLPAAFSDFAELDVEVKLVDQIASGVTAVPVSALVATSDGGFAVEVVAGSSTQFVGVDPGMFADGWVEVAGIDPGTAVVVPS